LRKPRKPPLRILFVASECTPLIKSGGLGDVVGALSKALARLGHEVQVVIPLYSAINRTAYPLTPMDMRLIARVGPDLVEGRVWTVPLPKSAVPVVAIEQPELFDREGLYGTRGSDYSDNLRRFSFFSQAALEYIAQSGFHPDIIHVHDWQAALACAQLRHGAFRQEPWAANARVVYTIHNLAYQGLFPREQWSFAGLPDYLFGIDGLEFYGQINCLKGGLITSDAVTTVSPTYAEEIQTPEEGCGLDGILRQRRDRLTGILNGIDMDEWNPRTDPYLAAHFSAGRLAAKAVCKQALQRRCDLPERADMLIGMVQRLAEQKGFDLVLKALDTLMQLPIQIAILGTGDPVYQRQLQERAKQFPQKLSVNLVFDNALAHQIEGGADAFLMPSRFEPCGLNQMYSMRYGTVPIVRKVGGLADTVTDMTPETLADRSATGFAFEPYTVPALIETVQRALAVFQDPSVWMDLIQNDMAQDFSWDRSAEAYVSVYEQARARGA